MTKKLEESTLPFREGNEFSWPSDFEESYYCLSRIRYAADKNDIFENGEFSENLETITTNWSFIVLVKSALYFHLECLKSSRKASNQPPFSWLDWYTLIFIFLNKNTSKKEVLDIIEYLYEAPDKQTLLGVKRAISSFTAFPFVPISPESLNNFLIFLKIDIVTREALVKKIFKKQNLDDLVDFLITMECSVNTSLVLTESLTFYFETLEKETASLVEIEKQINTVIDFTRLELEDFNVFDIMESSEQVKSGSSKLYVFSFNKTFLLSLIKNPSKNPLKIFELFEFFLYQTKQKTIFLIKISFETGGDLYKLISDFCFTCEKEIKFYAKLDLINSGLTLVSFVFTIIAGSLGLLLFFASSRSVSTRTSMLDQIKAKNSGNVAYLTMERFSLEEVQEEAENTMISEEISAENNKVVRTRQPSFGSIIPHFSKNPVKASQPVPITQSVTQSVSLQASRAVQVFQTFESTVRPTRSTPRGTTMSYGLVAREGNSSLVSFQQSNIELRRVPFGLKLPTPHDTDMNALILKLESAYPDLNLNVNQIHKKEGDVYLPTNQISIIGTSLQYKDCRAVKQEMQTFVNGRDLSLIETQKPTKLEFLNPTKLEGDHTKNIVQRKMLKLKDGEAGVVFIGKAMHNEMGDKRNYLMPNKIGYTPGTAGAMDLIDFIEEDNASVIKGIFDKVDADIFSAQCYEKEDLLRGYKNGSNIDREKVQEKIRDLGINDNIFLALNVNNLYDDGIAQNFNDFIDLVEEEKIDCKKACEDLTSITNRAFRRRQHAFSVGANLKEGTDAWRNFNKHEERAKDACKRAYNYVAGMTDYSEKYINTEAMDYFLGDTSDNPIPLEEAFEVTKDKLNLASLRKHPQPLYGSRLYKKNH